MPAPSNLLYLRTTLGWSQTRMASYLGCDQSTVSRMERSGIALGPYAKLYALLSDEVRRKADSLASQSSPSVQA